MLRLSTGLRTSLAGLVGFAGAFANGVIEIYSGAQPATADSAPTGTLLARVTQDGGAFVAGNPANGLQFDAAADGAVEKAGAWLLSTIVDGTAGWFRLKANGVDAGNASTSAIRMDGTVAVTGGDMALSNIALKVGTPATVDVFKFIVPAQ